MNTTVAILNNHRSLIIIEAALKQFFERHHDKIEPALTRVVLPMQTVNMGNDPVVWAMQANNDGWLPTRMARWVFAPDEAKGRKAEPFVINQLLIRREPEYVLIIPENERELTSGEQHLIRLCRVHDVPYMVFETSQHQD